MNSIESNFVPYQIALDMKSIGFDEPCFGYYVSVEVPNPFLVITKIYDTQGGYFTFAPLYQQAFRWLLALANKDKHFTNKWTISYNEDYYSLFLGGCNMGVFEAELECLKKLIEICGTQEK